MGKVIEFHDARASDSAGDRAASSAKSSAVKPAFSATGVRKIGSHHSAGMLSLCGHLRAAATPAPIAEASASGDGQRATTSRKLETMEIDLRHSVLKSKDNRSYDGDNLLGHTVLMAKDTKYREEFKLRTAWARWSAGFTQAVIAKEMHLQQPTYSKYEPSKKGRGTLLPHYLIPRFIELTGVGILWLFTEQGGGPAKALPSPNELWPPAARRKSKPRAPKRKKA